MSMSHDERSVRVKNLCLTVESMFDRGVIDGSKAIHLGMRVGMLYSYPDAIGFLTAEENLRIHFRELMGIHEEREEGDRRMKEMERNLVAKAR